MDGTSDGIIVGACVGSSDGALDGAMLGSSVGVADGSTVGEALGSNDGTSVGIELGDMDGTPPHAPHSTGQLARTEAPTAPSKQNDHSGLPNPIAAAAISAHDGAST